MERGIALIAKPQQFVHFAGAPMPFEYQADGACGALRRVRDAWWQQKHLPFADVDGLGLAFFVDNFYPNGARRSGSSRLSRAMNCLTMRSSSEWKAITTRRPPGASSSSAAFRPCSSSSSSALT